MDEIDANSIKSWIKNNLSSPSTNQADEELEDVTQENNEELDLILNKLKEVADLTSVQLKDTFPGKKYLSKPRKMLQAEIKDWTIYPYLDAQSYFNSLMIELVKSLIPNQNLKTLNQLKNNYLSLKKEMIELEIKTIYHQILNKLPDKESLEHYSKEILENRLTVNGLLEKLNQSEKND